MSSMITRWGMWGNRRVVAVSVSQVSCRGTKIIGKCHLVGKVNQVLLRVVKIKQSVLEKVLRISKSRLTNSESWPSSSVFRQTFSFKFFSSSSKALSWWRASDSVLSLAWSLFSTAARRWAYWRIRWRPWKKKLVENRADGCLGAFEVSAHCLGLPRLWCLVLKFTESTLKHSRMESRSNMCNTHEHNASNTQSVKKRKQAMN